jgi:organic radical activating enzyme
MSEVIGNNFHKTKQQLDSVGCGFCLAKWTQVTMHLHNGTTHSCHHPAPHKIGLKEIEKNHTALHNSKHKKKVRKEMLEGGRPEECNYCWRVEDSSEAYSDRVFKSEEQWSKPHFEEIKNIDWKEDYLPKYVEVSFANTCNFKCAYCGPEYSSTWVEEVRNHGGYPTSQNFNSLDPIVERNTLSIPQREHNPYIEAFWKWWPQLYKNMDTFRITGGEPLLSKDTWKVLDNIIETDEPNKNLKFSINSNLGVDDKLIEKLIEKLKIIETEGRVKEMIIYTSVDAYGQQADYVRYGLDFEKLFKNIDRILSELQKVTVVVMSTFNIFSIFSYEKLLKKVYEFKLKHFNTERYWNSALIIDTSYLRHPEFLSFRLLKDYLDEEYFERCIKFMKFHSTYRSLNSFQPKHISDVGFTLKEIEKVSRIRDIFVKDSLIDDTNFDLQKKDFLKFIEEYEVRRHLKCQDYFPELTNFINNIK